MNFAHFSPHSFRYSFSLNHFYFVLLFASSLSISARHALQFKKHIFQINNDTRYLRFHFDGFLNNWYVFQPNENGQSMCALALRARAMNGFTWAQPIRKIEYSNCHLHIHWTETIYIALNLKSITFSMCGRRSHDFGWNIHF